MWQDRQWRKLLSFIDHLPRNSYYVEAASNDEEHARMLLEASENQPKREYRPPMSLWTMEAEILADIADRVQQLTITTRAANSRKGAKLPKFVPYARPRHAIEPLRRARRQERHEALARRVLRRKREAG